MTRSWSIDKRDASHTITVTATGVSTSEIPRKPNRGPTFAGSYGLSEVLGGKHALDFRARFGADVHDAVLAAIREVLAAWTPPEVSATRETCPVCATLPAYVSADLREGQSLPWTDFVDAVAQFNGAIQRCPVCATYWRRSNTFELGYEDTDHLERLSPEEAARELEPRNHLEAAWVRARCG